MRLYTERPGPRLNLFLFSLCHTAGHYTTCAAHTLMSLFVWSFFLDLFEHKSESLQILLESRPICFQPSETWADRSESLAACESFFLAPHCSCTTDASTVAAYFLITVEDPHKTVYTRQAMIPPKSICTLDPSFSKLFLHRHLIFLVWLNVLYSVLQKKGSQP